MKKRMKRRRNREEKSVGNLESYHSTVNSYDIKPRCFFKLMLSPPSQSTQLRIPEKFAAVYIDELCTSTAAILTVPTGEKWEVTLIKEDNKLWFHEGWQKFVNNYFIGYGYFLMFKYEGNMRFNVHVFDLTACEISYQCDLQSTLTEKEPFHEDRGLGLDAPSKGEMSDTNNEEDDEDEDDDSDFECLGPPSCSQDYVSQAEVIELDDEDGDHVCDYEKVGSVDGRSDRSNDTFDARQGTSLTRLPVWVEPHKELLKAVTVAGITVPIKAFFLSVVKQYSLLKSFYISIPMAFARELLQCKADVMKIIKLEVADGRQWEVRCRIAGPKSTFGKGWITFARDFGLETGDVCVYEISPSSHQVLKVQVAKNSQIKAAGLDL